MSSDGNVCGFYRPEWRVTSAVCHVAPWGDKVGKVWTVDHELVAEKVLPPAFTCCKPLLAEREPVAAPLQLHVHPRQRAAFVHELHRQGGGVGRALTKLKLGPQGPCAWGSNTNTVSGRRVNQSPFIWNGLWARAAGQRRKRNREEEEDLPSLSDLSEMSFSFHRHLLCSAFLQWEVQNITTDPWAKRLIWFLQHCYFLFQQ